MYLKCVVRVDTAPAALLQLHLRVKIFLVLLHYVGQVRPPATLCVVLLTVAVVVLMVLKENKLKGNILGRDQQVHSFIFLSSYFGEIFGAGLCGNSHHYQRDEGKCPLMPVKDLDTSIRVQKQL